MSEPTMARANDEQTTDRTMRDTRQPPFVIEPRLASLLGVLALVMALFTAGTLPAAAQGGPLATRIVVNDRIITNWEVDQRARFLELFGTQGDLVREAEDRLIEERLQLAVADRMGIRLTDQQLREGMEEFAGRVDLTVEEFLDIVGTVGIDPESYRDFIRAGMLWREVARQRFAPLIEISNAEVDRAMATYSQRGAVRVLLSEIVLPTAGLQRIESARLGRQLAEIRTQAAFAAAARQHSVAESAARGGEIDWIPLISLPPELAGLLVSLSPGQVTPPIPLEQGITLYQLRRIEQLDTITPAASAVRYARLALPGRGSGAANRELERILDRVDACDDFHGVLRGASEETLRIETRKLPELGPDVAMEIARLNPGQGSTGLSQGDTLVYLHLCERTLAGADTPFEREGVRERIFNDRVGQMSSAFLAELRADAHIVRR